MAVWSWAQISMLSFWSVEGVKGPGGQRVLGHVLYFNAGDSPESGELGIANGCTLTY